MTNSSSVATVSAAFTEREITEPVDLCLSDGRLDPSAVGWSRRPLHRANLRGSWGRKKRWDYWCVTTREHMVSFTYADIDYIGLASVAFLDFATERWIEKTVVLPLAAGFSQPDTVGGRDITFDRLGLRLAMRELDDGTELTARFRAQSGEKVDAEIFVERPPGHETLTVVVPWSERVFQLTSKHNTRPARGQVRVDGRRHDVGPDNQGFACLDYGRGIWPYRTTWNWTSASGVQGNRTIGIQLGGTWTDGTGSTENALCVDGRLSKISEDLVYEYDRRDFLRPWRIRTPHTERVDLTFSPFYCKQLEGDLLVLGGQLHLCFGHFAGVMVDAAGDAHRIDDLLGWSEEVRVRW